jgi:predicted RND superfamily exporter protein
MHLQLTRIFEKVGHVVFTQRRALLVIFAVATVVLAYSATALKVDAGFNKMIPLKHAYMQTFTEHQKTFGGANRVIVALVQKQGDMFNSTFFAKLKQVTDDLFFLPGVDRSTVTSLYTPNVRFIEIVEDGFAGGNVIPSGFQGTVADLEQVQRNVLKSGVVGRLVANDFRGALVSAALLELDPVSGERLDYRQVAAQLETIRARHETPEIRVHIIGFAKAVGDIADGAVSVIGFFAVAFVISAFLLYFYCGSWRLTVLTLACALVPVVWLLGLLPPLGYGIDPMSILVPFLVFSIGVSHAVQMGNAWRHAVTVDGATPLAAARTAFVRLLVPGSVALVTDVLGFLVILHIEIDMVRELGITASLGLFVMILTNMLLLPVLLSYSRLSPGEIERSRRQERRGERLWALLVHAARPRPAAAILSIAALIFAFGLYKALELRTGDLGEGVPELRAESRYNQDVEAITRSFSIGVDVLSVIAQTNAAGACTQFEIMDAIDRFEWRMRQVEGVHSVLALPGVAKVISAGWNEGSLKWRALSRDPTVLAQSVTPVDTSSGLLNTDCSVMQVLLFMNDHQGETVAHVVDEIKKFKREHDSEQLTFRLAAGNVGVMAATNEAVDAAQIGMLVSIFGAIIVLCLVTFHSWRGTLCIVIPLVISSVLCQALMAVLGIGLKVSTLPVIALGVGIGVDYGIYLYERMQDNFARGGESLVGAFHEALIQRGTAVLFTATTMTVGVGSWAFSTLKFQADMGLLLAFMFLANMLGALLLLPALAAFLVRTPRRATAKIN